MEFSLKRINCIYKNTKDTIKEQLPHDRESRSFSSVWTHIYYVINTSTTALFALHAAKPRKGLASVSLLVQPLARDVRKEAKE